MAAKLLLLLLISVAAIPVLASSSSGTGTATGGTGDGTGGTGSADHGSGHSTGIKVADWHWESVKVYIVISMFIIVVCIIKALFHHIHWLTELVPESIMLIFFGVGIGIIVFFTVYNTERVYWDLTPNLFFYILLPPIMLEAAYSLYDRTFGENLGSILYFAVVGTVLAFFMIGFALYGLSCAGAMGALRVSLKTCLLFGSYIVAVDPVAVLAIFHDVGVEQGLYYLVFGESLLNDAVTVVLYKTMNAFMPLETASATDIILGIISFFTISLGGLLIGVVCGIICCLITRITFSERVVEPLVMLSVAYISYMIADMVGWSGLIAIISCGIVQAAYAFHNVSRKSLITIKYFSKMIASISEAIIFVYLGIELVKGTHVWHWGFALWSLALCLVARFIITFGSSAALNRLGRKIPISLTEQLIISFGGLRGAVAFALATLVEQELLVKADKDDNMRERLLTTTLFIIMFTCIIVGVIIKPMVKCLNIRLRKRPLTSVFHEVVTHTVDHLNAGIEGICGHRGDYRMRECFDRLDTRFFRRILQRDPRTQTEKIVDMYRKVALKMHYASLETDQKKSSHHLSALAPGLARRVASVASMQDLPGAGPSFPDLASLGASAGGADSILSMGPSEVRRVIDHQTRRASAQVHAGLSKSINSDQDVTRRLHDIQSRLARGLRLLHRGSSQAHKLDRQGDGADAGASNGRESSGVFQRRTSESPAQYELSQQKQQQPAIGTGAVQFAIGEGPGGDSEAAAGGGRSHVNRGFNAKENTSV